MILLFSRGKHARTFRAICTDPISGNIRWREIESLLTYLGAVITEGTGSRVHVLLNDVVAVFHRPLPEPDADKGAVKSVRRFLQAAGIEKV